jgi:preprotein translocase subunit YajC
VGGYAFVWLVLLVVAFFFLVVRPQRRQMATMRELQASLRVGDEVVTTSGIYGVVRTLGDRHLDLEVAPGTVIRIARGAISARQPTDAGPDADRPATD